MVHEKVAGWSCMDGSKGWFTQATLGRSDRSLPVLHPAPCTSAPLHPSTSAVQSSLHLCLPAPLPLCTSIPQPTWLFCGTNDGVVSLWDVGTPSLPTYDGVNPSMLLKVRQGSDRQKSQS